MLEKKGSVTRWMAMTETQLYFSIGLPVFTILLAFLGTVLQVNTIKARITSLETTMHNGFGSLETRFETLIGKVIEMDTRLRRVEERLDRR